jgi:cyclophilin family peptidyl-prolyl cis-trans isomerase
MENRALVVTSLALLWAAPALAGDAKSPWYVQFDVKNPKQHGRCDPDGMSMVWEVHDEWAPLGAARFREMVEGGFYDEANGGGIKMFRVIPGFMAQFGIHGDPAAAKTWADRPIQDDPVKQSNTEGMVSFATSGLHSRTTQIFVNYSGNQRLDGMGFAPFAKVIKGMSAVSCAFPVGEKPSQGLIQSQGNAYLDREFPELTYIAGARVVEKPSGHTEL